MKLSFFTLCLMLTAVLAFADEVKPNPYVHSNQFGFGVGVKQLWTPNSLDNLGTQVPRTFATAQMVYNLTKAPDGSTKLALTAEVSRTLISSAGGTQWPISLGMLFSFATPH